MAVVLQMGYAESLFAALSAGAILSANRGRWVMAGSLAFLAGATRPVGYRAAVPLLFIGLQMRKTMGSPMPSRLKIVSSAALGLASTPLYWAFVAIRAHRLTGWFDVEQTGWGTHFDWGESTAKFIWSTLTAPSGSFGLAVWVAFILLGSLVVLASISARDYAPYVVLGIAAFVSVAASTNFWHSKPRLLLAGALLVVPLALRLGDARLRYSIPVIAFGLVGSAWFGAYMITRWAYAI